MDKKSFIKILVTIIMVFAASFTIRHFQPESTTAVDFSSFPMQKGDWTGRRIEIPQYVYDLLKPKDILMAKFINSDGIEINLLFDFFTSEGSFGGPHSPQNCLPGSGWIIEEVAERKIVLYGREISTGRFKLGFEDKKSIMDFWYITNYGETANDFIFKIYSMLSSLTFQERNVGFVRIIAPNSEPGKKALADFEEVFVSEIYNLMPF